MSPAETSTIENAAPRRGRRWIIGAGVCCLLLLIFAPFLLSVCCRDQILAAVLDDPELNVTSRSASFGWFSPTAVAGVKIVSTDQRLELNIESIEFQKSAVQLWLNNGDLGTITLRNPDLRLDLNADEVDELPAGSADPGGPTFDASVRDGDFSISVTGDTVIELHDFNFDLKVAKEAGSRILSAQLQPLLDHRPVSPELSEELLQWIDPALADVVEANGSVSLMVDELRIPLDVSDEECLAGMVISGSLALHDLTAATRTPILSVLLRLAADPESKRPGDTIRIVETAKLSFHVAQGRIHHAGLVSGILEADEKFPVRSHGSIGFDESLDLTLQVPVSLFEEKLASDSGQGETLSIRVLGTISEPVMQLPEPSE